MPRVHKLSRQFDLYSDLHADESDRKINYRGLQQSDDLILAGDISRSFERSVRELKEMAKVYRRIHVIDGNYEFIPPWTRTPPDLDMAKNKAELRDVLFSAAPNVNYLTDFPLVEDGLAIVGGNTHWDFRAAEGHPTHHATREDAIQMQMDMYGISRYTATVGPEEGDREVEALCKLVAQFNKAANIDTIVVVTHTVPHVPGTGYLEFPETSSPLNMSTMSNTNTARILGADVNNKIRFWLSGHQHRRKAMVLEKKDGHQILFASNPRGGRRDEMPQNYGPLAIDFAREPGDAIRSPTRAARRVTLVHSM